MPLPRFRIRTLMIAVAVGAATLAALVLWAQKPHTGRSTLFGWSAFYVIPLALLIGWRVPVRQVARASGRIVFKGSFWPLLSGFIGFAMVGYVGLVGGFLAGLLSLGWIALFVPAVDSNHRDKVDAHSSHWPRRAQTCPDETAQ